MLISGKRLVAVLLGAISSMAIAQSTGGIFEINNTTIDNGGGRSIGGQFTLTGTIGQPDAWLQTASSGQFHVTGGFWAHGEIVPAGNFLFSDGFEGP